MNKREFLHLLEKMEHQWSDEEIIHKIKQFRLHKDIDIPIEIRREWENLIAAGTRSLQQRRTQRRHHRPQRQRRHFKLKKKHIRRHSRKAH